MKKIYQKHEQNATISKELATGNLLANEEKEFDLRVFLKESVTQNDPVENKTFKSKVVIISTLNKNLIGPRYTIVSGVSGLTIFFFLLHPVQLVQRTIKPTENKNVENPTMRLLYFFTNLYYLIYGLTTSMLQA